MRHGKQDRKKIPMFGCLENRERERERERERGFETVRVAFGLFMGLRGCISAFVEGGSEVCGSKVR